MSAEYENNGMNSPEPEQEQHGVNASGPEQGAYRMSGDQIPGSQPDAGQNPYGYTRSAQPGAGQNPYTYPRSNQNPGQAGAGQNPYHHSGPNPGQPGAGQSSYSYSGPNPGYGYSQAYGNQNPAAGYAVRQPQPKKKSGSRKVVALALVCALIGGLGGGAAVGMALRGGASAAPAAVEESREEASSVTETAPQTDAAPQTETKEEAEASEERSNIHSTVIEVTTNSPTTSMTPQDVYEKYVNAVVAISNEGTTTNVFGQVSETASSGSGFIISEDGYIVTNNHVVAGAQTLTVTMTNGEEFEAEIIGADPENDVALIKIDASGLPVVAVGDSASIEVGQQVCAIGNPLGELTNTLTVGYVSALDREINESGTPINMFQTDCAINAGNSGGPIFDMHGNVVGITTAKYSAGGSFGQASIEGIGFCVPIDDAMDIVSDLLECGYVKGRASLGISCQAISSTVTQYYHLPVGVYVYSVMEGSAADKAGVKEGDIITAIDGNETESITELKSQLKNYTAGDTAVLSVYRSDENGAETLELPVTFDEKQ